MSENNTKQLNDYYDRSERDLKNSILTVFGENHKRQVLFLKISGNTTKSILINELKNRRLVYFYVTCDNDISFKTNLWELMPQSFDHTTNVGIDESINGGGYIDSPFGFNLVISSTVKFIFSSLTANPTKIKIVFHTTELME